MKRLFVGVIVLLVSLFAVTPSRAQSTVTNLEGLSVDIWPDYDRPSVLILLTGIIPTGTTFPAQVVIPIPEDATVNAVARIDDSTGNMLTDIEYDDSIAGQITLTTSSPVFRVEYYVPYEAQGIDRTYSFSWRADTSVDEFLVNLQQPVAAANLTTDPGGATVVTGADGLRYSNFPVREVPAGQTYTLDISYEMPVSQLTVDLLQPAATPLPVVADPASPSADQGQTLDWQLVIVIAVVGLVIVGLVLVIVWLITSRQATSSRGRKPRPVRRTASSNRTATGRSQAPSQTGGGTQVRFCHQCGQPVEAGDRFCRECGAALKGG